MIWKGVQAWHQFPSGGRQSTVKFNVHQAWLCGEQGKFPHVWAHLTARCRWCHATSCENSVYSVVFLLVSYVHCKSIPISNVSVLTPLYYIRLCNILVGSWLCQARTLPLLRRPISCQVMITLVRLANTFSVGTLSSFGQWLIFHLILETILYK